MRRAALICTALTTAMAAAPLAAQQTPPSAPPAHELAPPVQRTSTEAPPPFPHYPKAKPREHDPNYHPSTRTRSTKTSHHNAKTSHSSKTAHASKASHQAKAKHPTKAQRHATRETFSKRTIRQCHAMSYSQIMSHEHCRTIMKQDLEAHSHKAAERHSSAKHSSKTQKTKTKTKTKRHRR
jgi:hypothetical protein